MNAITEILCVECVDADLSAANQKVLFQQLASAAARKVKLPAKEILGCIADREKLGSTGFGNGIAIPHGKLEGLDQVFGYFGRLPAPIDYNAVDKMPVDLVFLLLSPPNAGADHLKALASVSRVLRDKALLAKLRGARSKDAIYALLSGIDAAHAA